MKSFEDFSRRRHIRWKCRNQPSEYFSDEPLFHRKCNWKPSPAHPGWKLFLSQLVKEIFNGLSNDFVSVPSNTSKEEREELRGLADDISIAMKQAFL